MFLDPPVIDQVYTCFDGCEPACEKHAVVYMRKAGDMIWPEASQKMCQLHSIVWVMGGGVRQMIPSGLRPVELLQECRAFKRTHGIIL